MKRPKSALPLLSVSIKDEGDIVRARQIARQLAQRAGLGQQDQARLATAVSEIARNAFQYAGGGRAEFSIDVKSSPQVVWVEVIDQGPGIKNLDGVLGGSYESTTGMGVGLSGTRRLMDHFRIHSEPGQGTRVTIGKAIPASAKTIIPSEVARIGAQLPQEGSSGPHDELQFQNKELLRTLENLRTREVELEKRESELAQLSLELQETNRGVVALYAELDEKAAALKRADEMKSHFLRYVSHEFRTPVNAVLALTQLLLRRLDGELTSEQEKQVLYIRQAVQDLADMVNDLLDLAKVEAGKTEIRPTRVDLAEFFGATRALMRPLATNEAVSLTFDDPPPGILETDESKLGQILRNMISNALKFTEAGEVRVAARCLSDGRLCFSVSDTGVGIAPEHLETIFQEFAQVDNKLQKLHRGTGLGLPLSRKLAELLGGTLEASSTPGQGSTFSLTLPIALNTSDGRRAPGDTILIIDDEEASRYLTRQLFRESRYRIIEARNGPEGTERARFEHPALILLDLMMPYQNGFNVLDELQSDESTRDIPVVIQTSKTLTEIDHDRLASRQATILPKAVGKRLPALTTIRELLREPDLFSEEPEFIGSGQRV